MLPSGCRIQESFRARIHGGIVFLQNNRANRFRDRASSRLPGNEHLVPRLFQFPRERVDQRRFARAVPALYGNKDSSHQKLSPFDSKAYAPRAQSATAGLYAQEFPY